MAATRQRNRQRRRRGRFGGLYKLLSVLLVFAALLVGCVVFFRVNRIEVIGNARYSVQEVIAASGVETGDNLFLVNRSRTNSNLIRELPYIQKAAMVRRLPDTIELHIVESSASALVRSGEETWIIDPRGKLLERSDGSYGSELPLVLGLTPQSPTLGEMMTVSLEEQTGLDGMRGLLTALSERGLAGQVTEFIDLRGTSVIYFGFGEGLTVAVPMTGDFAQRAFELERVMEKFRQRGERVTGTLALTYGEGQAHLLPDRWLPEEYRPQPVLTAPVEPPEITEEAQEG